MAQLDLFQSIAEQYQKHGFMPRRCLMTAETLGELKTRQPDGDTFLEASVEPAALDAIWFARASGPAHEAWELRLVSSTPLSLLERIPLALSEAERDTTLKSVEGRLAELIGRRKEAIEEIVADARSRGNGADDENDDEEDDEDFDEDEIESSDPGTGNGRRGNGSA